MSSGLRTPKLVMAVAIAYSAMASGAFAQGSGHKSGLPDVAAATDIPYPVNTTAIGMVSLVLTLDATGNVQNTMVLQDTPPLTKAAQAAVQTWKFKPATVHGKAAASLLPIYVVFNPYNPAGTAPVGGGLTGPPPMSPNNGSPVPPQVRLISYAMYPANTVATGTVVLSMTIDSSGHATQTKVLRGAHPLTDAALQVVQQWGFQPATVGGAPVTGRICVAFVFQRNLD